MSVSKANQRAVNKYVKNNYDRINVTMPKGKKETIQVAATAAGESVNAYINGAIDGRMDRDSRKGPSEAAGASEMVGVIPVFPDTLQAAQEAAEAAGESLEHFVDRAIEETADRDLLPKEAIFNRAVDVVAGQYEVSCWDVLRELDRMKAEKEGGKPNE